MYRPAQALTVANAKIVLEAGLRAITDGQTHFDLTELSAFDSSAVATMLAWQRAAHNSGKTLVFNHVPVSLQSLCELYGVSTLIHTSTGAIAPTELRADLPHH